MRFRIITEKEKIEQNQNLREGSEEKYIRPWYKFNPQIKILDLPYTQMQMAGYTDSKFSTVDKIISILQTPCKQIILLTKLLSFGKQQDCITYLYFLPFLILQP